MTISDSTILALYVFASILVAGGAFCAYGFNQLTHLRDKCRQTLSGLDVQYKLRYDLIPALVKVTEEYSAYEHDVLKNIIQLRSQEHNLRKTEGQEKQTVELQLSQLLSQILIRTEQSPELKAGTVYNNLQKQIAEVEQQIASICTIYNANVTLYNTARQTFPLLLVAKLWEFKEMSFLGKV